MTHSNNASLSLIERSLITQVEAEISKLGLHYRLFSRVKNLDSVIEKIERKSYSVTGKKMQDLFGLRVTTYFIDDLKILLDLFESKFRIIDRSFDEIIPTEFKPMRKNLVCKLEGDNIERFDYLAISDENYKYVDSTFEIQFRTTFSEGWHEVEHSLRYKCKDDWQFLAEENRMLNGILATLETSDNALKALFDDIAYKHYKSLNWVAMLRNKLRLNFSNKKMSDEVSSFLNSHGDVAKELFKIDRDVFLKKLIELNINMPMSFENVIYFMNYFYIKNVNLGSMTPSLLIEKFKT